jgi:hypothetical protein
MANHARELTCAVCRKPIPAGAGAFRRGNAYVHVECAEKPEKKPPRKRLG